MTVPGVGGLHGHQAGRRQVVRRRANRSTAVHAQAGPMFPQRLDAPQGL